MTSSVVLVTGAADFWGSRLVRRLRTEPRLHIIGMDNRPPKQDMDFVQANLCNPLLADLLRGERVDTVCHLKFVHSAQPNAEAYNANVRGSQNLLSACAEAGVGKVVFKSSQNVYGAHPDNPMFVKESQPLRASCRYGYNRDLVEIECLLRSAARDDLELVLINLRFASIVGPTACTPMTRFLRNRWAPALLGFDPMLQLIHQDDVIEALAHATLRNIPGVFNIAAPGAMPLSRAIALSGKPLLPVAHGLLYWGTNAARRSWIKLETYAPIDPDYLRYSLVGDLSRMREHLGFAPRHTAEEALHQFAARYHNIHTREALAADEKRLRATLQQRHTPEQGEC